MIDVWKKVWFSANTRKKHLDKFDAICRENDWVTKGEQTIRDNTSPYVIMFGGELAGYFAINKVDGNQACFWGFYIYPKYRNQGVGTIVLQKIALTHLKLKTNCLFCYVHKDNAIALHLYQKYGYIYGKDERLYDTLETCSNPMINDKGEYTIVFLQRVWEQTQVLMKGELENVFNSHDISK